MNLWLREGCEMIVLCRILHLVYFCVLAGLRFGKPFVYTCTGLRPFKPVKIVTRFALWRVRPCAVTTQQYELGWWLTGRLLSRPTVRGAARDLWVFSCWFRRVLV